MSTVLPKGWASAKLADIAEINPRHPSGLNDTLRVTFVPMAAVSESNWAFKYTEESTLGQVRKGYTHFAEDDILFAKITPCMENGKAAVAKGLKNKLGCGTTELHVVRPRPGIDKKYIYHFVHQDSFRREAAQHFTGSAGQLRVPVQFMREAEFPIPPANEQRRIVSKLEHLLDKLDNCQKRLDKIPVILKRFRLSILNAAIAGKLTADWRTNNVLTDTAKKQLEELLAKAAGQRPRMKEAETTEGHETITDLLPGEWTAVSLEDLFRFIDYRGKTPKKSNGGKRLISAKNIKMGYISEEPVEYVSKEFYRSWMTRGFPKKGDILFVTEGHTMGFTALNNRDDEFALSQRTITLQPWQPVETRCFFYFIMSTLFQNLVRLNATGSAAVGIKAAKFRGLPIPFPPLSEQKEIVQRVEELFALADQIETRYAKAKAHLDKIAQSILVKAFRGELVPQDPNDEPADVLLKCIREGQLAGAPAKKKRSKERIR